MHEGPKPRAKRRIVWVVLGLVVGVGAADLLRPPEAQAGARFVVAAIDLYQATVSPQLPKLGVRCRFTPTCSHYTETSIRRLGLVKGLWWSTRRLFRCGPWTPLGTLDPPQPSPQARHSPGAP